MLLNAGACRLLVIDLQIRLMPAIAGAADVLANAAHLLAASQRLGVGVLATEQNPSRLGATVAGLLPGGVTALAKMDFNACAAPEIAAALSEEADKVLVVCGAEAHVCVLQTVLALRADGRRVAVVSDATGSRTPANHGAALARMAACGPRL